MHQKTRPGNEFNPGIGAATRFAFFGNPVVPVLYAAATEQAAIAESLLHDIPLRGGALQQSAYTGNRMSRLTTTRDLRLALLAGLGLRRLGVIADQVTSTPAAEYSRTVLWAEAAHKAGFDGVAYMSRQCNSDGAYAFFGDLAGDAFDLDLSYQWNFGDASTGRQKLIDFCSGLRVNVIVR
ncbi:RES family NAD+ phosphorylase [Paramicrobacterium humi]|uniref:RES family NAD+ phosphorylase n=1 Tax=Paramicrobacterium humi TaxID=640635 RepID=UPI0015A3F47A|nr:RES family NAD+ phosphorylase [Microbacterium humi]